MHYSLALITKTIPTEDEISDIMKPFNDYSIDYDSDIRPVFSWDWYQIGGRYSGQIKIKFDEQWFWSGKELEKNGKIFHSHLLTSFQNTARQAINNYFREEKWFTSMGANDGILYVDGAQIKDIINIDDICVYSAVDFNGNAITTKHYDGKNFIDNPDFEKQLKDMIAENQDGFLTILDYHD